MSIWSFLGGLLLGGTLGILIMALCHVSGRESDREDDAAERHLTENDHAK